MLEWLFDTSMGVPGLHGRWPAWLTILFHLSNLVAAVDLIAMPIVVLGLWSFHRRGVGGWTIFRAICFLPALGICRGVRVIELWGPPYHLTAIVDGLAAICTTVSVFTLPGVFRHILLLPSRREVHDLRDELQAVTMARKLEVKRSEDRQYRLRRRLEMVEDAVAQSLWTNDTRNSIAEIRQMLHDDESPSGEKERADGP